MHGDEGSDFLFGLNGNDQLYGGEGRDFLYGGRDADTVHGGAGDDEVRGNLGHDSLFGDDGQDDVRGGGGNDFLDAGAGDDFLFGENGNDTVFGGTGDDALSGGLSSGTGDGFADTFIFVNAASGGGGFDRVKDFEDGLDKIDLSGFGFIDFSTEVLSLASDTESGLRFNFGDGDVLFIENFFSASLDTSDVILS